MTRKEMEIKIKELEKRIKILELALTSTEEKIMYYPQVEGITPTVIRTRDEYNNIGCDECKVNAERGN